MKVHIYYPFLTGPWGGANQFLKAIKTYLYEHDLYEEDISKADIVLVNSSPTALELNKLFTLKRTRKDLLLVNRIDGPVYLIRGRNPYIDKAFYIFNETFCDGTIFQSQWSREQNYALGMKKNKFETTIVNAPDPKLFHKKDKKNLDKKSKIKIIATSWSDNWKKGFSVYQWLDEHLDFEKYEMTFVGNSPVRFQNIILKSPMNSYDLASALKEHAIFITASENDPCSNALIEALHCGLPAIALRDGGHPELIGKGGEVFDTKEQIPSLLKKISENYDDYVSQINLPEITDIGKAYYSFMLHLYQSKQNPQNVSYIAYMKIQGYRLLWRISEKMFIFRYKLAKVFQK